MEDRVALITGASSGLGAITAATLAKSGYYVWLVARRRQALAHQVAQIQAGGGRAAYLAADLSEGEARQELYQRIIDESGSVDVLVNNAGLGWYGYCEKMSWELARQMIDVNVVALTQLTLLFLPGMKKRKQGHIINISSIAGSLPSQGIALYSGTKSYVDSFTTALHREVRGSGVRISLVKPGALATPFFETAAARDNGRDIPAAGMAITPERVADAIVRVIEKPQRIVYVPRILGLVPFVEPLFGWVIDLLGPLLLKRQPTPVIREAGR